jgi:PAS domain S-box-containing protein
MSEAVIAADQNEQFLVFNPSAAKLFGVGATPTHSNEWSERYGLYLPDRVTPFPGDQLPLARCIRGESVNNVEMFVRHAKAPNGLWALIDGRPLTNEQGAPQGGVIVCHDITARKQAEEELAYERYLLHSLMDTVPDRIYFKDKDSRFLRVNKALAQRVGLSDPAECLGKTDFDLFTEEHAQQAYEDEQEIIRTDRDAQQVNIPAPTRVKDWRGRREKSD